LKETQKQSVFGLLKVKTVDNEILDKFKAYMIKHYQLKGIYNVKAASQKRSDILNNNGKSEFETMLDKAKEFIEIKRNHYFFTDLLIKYRDERQLSDNELYGRALIDRRLYHKIIKDRYYHPEKNTIISLGIGLKLNREQMDKLLAKAGFMLSYSLISDLVIMFCLEEEMYDIHDINALLYATDQRTLSKKKIE
jgi:hypothetical protein